MKADGHTRGTRDTGQSKRYHVTITRNSTISLSLKINRHFNDTMTSRSDQDASSSSRTALPFGSASAYDDTFPSPSSSSPLSDYRNRGNARRVAGVSEETLRASVLGQGEARGGGILEVNAETCYQLSLFKGMSAFSLCLDFGLTPSFVL